MKFKTRAIKVNQYQNEGNFLCIVVRVPFFFLSAPKNNWNTLIINYKINCH